MKFNPEQLEFASRPRRGLISPSRPDGDLYMVIDATDMPQMKSMNYVLHIRMNIKVDESLAEFTSPLTAKIDYLRRHCIYRVYAYPGLTSRIKFPK